MSIFKRSSNDTDKGTSETAINWRPLTEMQQLDEIVEASKVTPVAIFKNSTTCGISRMALKGLQRDYAIAKDELDMYMLDLLQYRSLSNEIAQRFGVYHESPQLLLIKDGKCVYHTSHSSIDADELKAKLN